MRFSGWRTEISRLWSNDNLLCVVARPSLYGKNEISPISMEEYSLGLESKLSLVMLKFKKIILAWILKF